MSELKAKIFSYCTTDINPPNDLQINQWLEENPRVDILHTLQSESMVAHANQVERNLTITLLYREA